MLGYIILFLLLLIITFVLIILYDVFFGINTRGNGSRDITWELFWEKIKNFFLWRWMFQPNNKDRDQYEIKNGVKLYGNAPYVKTLTEEPPKLTPIKKDNRVAFLWGGDTSRNLENGCNEDLYHVLFICLFCYKIPLENIVLVTQKEKKMDDLVYSLEKHFDTNIGLYLETTKNNIDQGIEKTLKLLETNPLDQQKFLYFHYSGHGDQTLDIDGDELDGYDEFILDGYDPNTKKYSIRTDDQLYQQFLCKIPKKCFSLFIMDQCHSGTSLDLPFYYDFNNKSWKQASKISSKTKNIDAIIYSMSASSDYELAYQGKYKDSKNYGGPITIPFYEVQINGKPAYYLLDDIENLYENLRLNIYDRFNQKSILCSSVNKF